MFIFITAFLNWRFLALYVFIFPSAFHYSFPQLSSLSSFAEMNAALSLLSPENRTALPRESFGAFSRIMCGHPQSGGERIPSLNWYEDNNIKSFLGRNGTEDVVLDTDNNTSKRLFWSGFSVDLFLNGNLPSYLFCCWWLWFVRWKSQMYPPSYPPGFFLFETSYHLTGFFKILNHKMVLGVPAIVSDVIYLFKST